MNGIKIMFIPVYKPFIGEKEKEYVNDCLDSTWISSRGKYVELFEKSFADKIGAKYATAVCNGTVALHLALLTLGISEGDEVIVPTFTYIASVNAIKYVGATPVFVDCDASSWQIDPSDIQRKITKKTKAILVVHLYGHACDMGSISQIANNNNLFVIEDCAEAIGTKYKNIHAGNFGTISTFSFFGNKTITTGEGGMVVTNNHTLYEKANHLKSQGLANQRQYWHDVIGYNYRMTNVAAAIGYGQMERFDEIIKQKRNLAMFYNSKFEDSCFEIHRENSSTYHSYWMNSILIPKDRCGKTTRDEFRSYLQEKGIETRPLFYPVHTMPMYSAKYEMHKNSEDISMRGINIPSYPTMTEEERHYVIDTVLKYENRLKSFI